MVLMLDRILFFFILGLGFEKRVFVYFKVWNCRLKTPFFFSSDLIGFCVFVLSIDLLIFRFVRDTMGLLVVR